MKTEDSGTSHPLADEGIGGQVENFAGIHKIDPENASGDLQEDIKIKS